MIRALSRIIPALAVLVPAVGLQALGEVRLSTLDSAVPQSRVCLVSSTAIMESNIKTLPDIDFEIVSVYSAGATLNIRVNPKLELGGGLLFSSGNTAGELSAKVLCWQDGRHYLSLKPTLIASQGKIEHENQYSVVDWVESGYARGFSLPVLYTLDTWRNLTLNASAGINCEWVKVWGTYTDTGDQNYEIGPSPMLHAQLNLNMEATYGIFYLIPEVGICAASFQDQGIKILGNYGFAIGAKW